MKVLVLIATICATPFISGIAVAEEGDEAVYYVLQYTPGENWKADIPYEEQPGIERHLGYLDKLFEERRLLMGGRLRGQPSGLMILRTDSLEAAQKVVDNDPGVMEGIVDATVSTWDVRMSSMRWVKRRARPAVQDPDEPWHLKRIDPSAPITLEERDGGG